MVHSIRGFVAARRVRLAATALLLTGATAITACGGNATGTIVARRALKLAHWTRFAHLKRPLDLAGPRGDGSTVLAAAGRLSLLKPTGGIQPFPSTAGGYRSPGGEEPYIALSAGGCFGPGTVYALRLASGRGVVAVSAQGAVRRLATLGAPGLIDGIAFDGTGGFHHALLVTINAGSKTTVDAINCHGVVTTITRSAPRVEGGIAVAPASFGRFAGDLIAPSETSGRIFAITPDGKSVLVARSGLPHGNDVGVESEAFVPRAPTRDALVADRATPGNPHPGDDVVLRIRRSALTAAGVRPGDLLVATEGGSLTDAVSCSSVACRVRLVADGPRIAHVEGHIVFAATR
jgi:hypothetical protein